jgi:hypothetical protein
MAAARQRVVHSTPDYTDALAKEPSSRRRAWIAAVVVLAVIAGIAFSTSASRDHELDAAGPTPDDSVSDRDGLAPTVEQIPTDLDGWTAIERPDGIGFVPTSFVDTAMPGDATRVFADNHEDMIGYWIFGLGYVDTATFEAADFDWRAELRTRFSPELAEERIDTIEERGGVRLEGS